MFYDQLTALCKAHNTTPTAFVTDILGLSSSKITAWKSGSIPKYGILKDIAAHFGVPVSYLFVEKNEVSEKTPLSEHELSLLKAFKELNDFDKGQVLSKAETLAEIASQKAVEEAKKLKLHTATADEEPVTIAISVFDLPVSAGTGVFLSDNGAEPLDVLTTPEAERANFALRVSGNSMSPTFRNKDIVLVESTKEIQIGEIGIFIADGEGYIKERGESALISHNNAFTPLLFSDFEYIKCIGRVLGKAELAKTR